VADRRLAAATRAARSAAASAPRPRRPGAAARPGACSGIPPTPELLAKVDALPPAKELPGSARPGSRAPDPHFTLRRLLRPIALALFIGLVLDGLDAVASSRMPALVRGGIDNGVQAKASIPSSWCR
jgi:ATP-binding cassette subfamily B protein